MGMNEARDFDAFVERTERRLRPALIASLGAEVGRDATCEALAYAWEHWERVSGLEHPVAYLYKVGRSASRRYRRPLRALLPAGTPSSPWVEPALERSLDRLTHPQRVAVVLVHGFEWTHQEVADLLEVQRSTVQNHLERGLVKLRSLLEVEIHA